MSTSTADLNTHDEHGGHAGGHPDDPHHQHHFATMDQQFDTAKIGMWLFLITEILLFGGLFVGFGLMQHRYPQEFVEAHEHLKRWQGSLNTVVLLFSSWTMVMAVNASQTGQKKKLLRYLLMTIVCAFIFLTVKYFEYSHKFEEGLLPAMYYHHKGDLIPGSHGYATFFAFYFMMTGLHGIHIVGGIVALTWIYRRAQKNEFSAAYYTPVDLVGLYWHIVDMIWIYLFPLYYLIT